MNRISYAFASFSIAIFLTNDICLVLCSNKTEVTTSPTTNGTQPGNEVAKACQCIDNKYLNKDEPGNCTSKSWAFKYGKLWCYVELPSNCTDLKSSTLGPNRKYSAQA